MPLFYSALIDSRSFVLLALSSQIPLITFLAESEADTTHIHDVNSPNYLRSFPLSGADPLSYPTWTWDFKSRTFIATKKDALTDALRARSLLAVAKKTLVRDVLHHLAILRSPAHKGVLLQEEVYLSKKIEAQRFKDSGYDEKNATDYPYLLLYADYAGVTLRQAADDVLFKAKLADDMLARTETIRIKYFNLIKEVSDPGNVSEIRDDFMRECYSVAIV